MTWTWMDAVSGFLGAIGAFLLLIAFWEGYDWLQRRHARRLDERLQEYAKRRDELLKTARGQRDRTNRERPWPNEPWH